MSTKKKYKHIFFDLDNTLWDFHENSYCALQQAFFHFKLDDQNVAFEDFFQLYSLINRQLWEMYRKQQVSKKELIVKRFSSTFEKTGISDTHPESFNKKYLHLMPQQNKLNKGAKEILIYLKKRGYKLYIITNGFREVQHKKIESSGLNSYFIKTFISEDIKMPKPAPEVFEYAIKSANAKKDQSLMVGDDWDVDIEGALNFGIDAVYFNSKENLKEKQMPGRKRTKSLYFVNQLVDLKTIL